MSHHDKDDHDDDHEHEEHEDHDDHEDFHLEIHRAVDELGKYAIDIEISSKAGIPKDTMKKFIEDLMTQATNNSMKHGADLIGHVKSILLCDKGNIMSSIVDERKPIKIKDNLEADKIYDAKFTMHVIVHGIWDDKVRDATLEVLPGVFKKWDIPYKIIADYYDTEKSIAHHM